MEELEVENGQGNFKQQSKGGGFPYSCENLF